MADHAVAVLDSVFFHSSGFAGSCGRQVASLQGLASVQEGAVIQVVVWGLLASIPASLIIANVLSRI